MTGFCLSENAERELAAIFARVEAESGTQRAERVRAEFERTFRNLAKHPGMGHERPDLTARAHRFWPVYSFLVVYRPDTAPVEVVDILHGARDPSDFRDRVGEPETQYAVTETAAETA